MTLNEASICQGLLLRELGLPRHKSLRGVRNVHRLNLRLLKRLVCSPSREFRSISNPLITQGDFIYDDGKLFQRNNTTKTYDCYSVRQSTAAKKRLLYSLSSRPRWEDQELWIGPIPGDLRAPLRNSAHRPSLFVLRLDNTLNRHDVMTGLKYESVYLSSTRRFKELSCDGETGLIILKSTKNHERECRGALTGVCYKDLLVSFAVFQYPPLEFLAMFDVRKSVFGVDVVDAVVNQGLLIAMHKDKRIRMYSLEYILENFKSDDFTEAPESPGHSLSSPGLPINVSITHLPPCLFEVKSHHHHLQIGANPWRYIVSEAENHYKVMDLDTHKLLGNGNISNLAHREPDQLLFHPDETSRILHYGSSKFRVLQISPDSGGLSEVFCHSIGGDASPDPADRNLTVTITRSGRHVTPSARIDMSEAKHDIAFDYEDELGLLVLLEAVEYVPDDDNDDLALRTRLEKVLLIDSFSHELLREIPIGEVVRQGTDLINISVTLDQDVLIVRVKSAVKSTALVYKLLPADREDSDWIEPIEGRPVRPRVRRRGRRIRREDARTLRRRSTWNERYTIFEDDSASESDEAFQPPEATVTSTVSTASSVSTRSRYRSASDLV